MAGRFDLAGRVALVTGGTRGLGRALARGLAEAGAAVALTGRRQDACDAAAAALATETGREVAGVACHMGDWDALPGLVERVYARFGRLDVLVNNAGISPAPVPLAAVTSEFFDKLYAVNVKGPMRLAALVAPRMGEAGGGAIVNVITVGAYRGGPMMSTYTSSKAALLNLTRCMAGEWAPLGVRVNAVAPGPFRTAMLTGAERNMPGLMQLAADATLQKRVADPDELVGAVVFLASGAASFVTGEDLVVAGGLP